jgi:hypothetical protein
MVVAVVVVVVVVCETKFQSPRFLSCAVYFPSQGQACVCGDVAVLQGPIVREGLRSL